MNWKPLIVFYTTLTVVVTLFYVLQNPFSNAGKEIDTPDVGLRVTDLTVAECAHYFSHNGGYFVLYTKEFKYQLIREDDEVEPMLREVCDSKPQLKPQVMAPAFVLSGDGFNITNEKVHLQSIVLLARAGTALSQKWATAIDRHLWCNQEGEIELTLTFDSGSAISYIVLTVEDVKRMDELS
jgi:hypothetical protein